MRFTFESIIRASPERVFAFHELPDALLRLTPPFAGVRIRSERSSTRVGAVSRVTIRLAPLVWITGEYLHVAREAPHYFEDRQVRGAFRSWTHRHRIEAHPEGTRLVDDIEFEPPRIARPFARWLILPRLRRIFAWRHEATRAWCEEQIAKSWTANAAAWRTAVRERSIESRRVATDAAIVDAVLAQRPRTVLDLGCGEGWLARALASRGIEVTGVDGSAELIASAKELGGGEFHVLRYDELPRLGRTFDVAVANFSLLDEVLPELPAPVVVIQTVHPSFAAADGWQVEDFATMPGQWREPMPWYFRTLDSWRAALARAGYTLAETREPRHPESGAPLSVILVARRVSSS